VHAEVLFLAEQFLAVECAVDIDGMTERNTPKFEFLRAGTNPRGTITLQAFV
jgi:hypothetical protein